MSTSHSFSKVNMIEEAELDRRRRTRIRIAITALSAAALVAIVVVLAVAASGANSTSEVNSGADRFSSSLKAICNATLYPDSCRATLSEAANGTKLDPVKLYQISVQVAMAAVSRTSRQLDGLKASGALGDDSRSLAALAVCRSLLESSYRRLNESATSADLKSAEITDDFKTWLSAALTYQRTCLDGFDGAPPEVRGRVADYLRNSTELSSNSLAILTQVSDLFSNVKFRRLMGLSREDGGGGGGGFPTWVSTKDRKLLQSPDLRATANIVVAKDGTGNFATIGEAVKAVPLGATSRTVIYVKKGVYAEIVRVTADNVLMIGDGKDATIVTGSLNVVDGIPTYDTPTFAVTGKSFIGIDMAFVNTAGPAKQQAVAMMSDSDLSVFYRCRFDGHQDTLCPLTQRQFYRECDVIGTVDFIFGNAAVVLQNCTILPRLPLQGQPDVITAQGRSDPYQTTGTSIHSCVVAPYGGDLAGVRVYLGRPWMSYSRAVFMSTYLPGAVDPAGWMEWTAGEEPPSTIFYGEFQNSGPGAAMVGRVKWEGVRALSPQEADGYTVVSFIGGAAWLPGTSVPFNAGI